MRRAADREGFTLLEAALWGLLASLIAALAAGAMHWARLTWTVGVEKLDQFGALRLASLRLSHELGYARGLLYPPKGQTAPYHQLLFLGETNEVRGCYVDPDGRLYLVTRDSKDSEEPLTRNTISLDISRPSANYVEYLITVKDENGKEIALGDGIWIRNHD